MIDSAEIVIIGGGAIGCSIRSRDPRPPEVICYSLTRGRGQGLDLYFGEVREIEQTSKRRFVVRGPEGDGPDWIELDRRAVVGSATWVWWPGSRRRIGRAT